MADEVSCILRLFCAEVSTRQANKTTAPRTAWLALQPLYCPLTPPSLLPLPSAPRRPLSSSASRLYQLPFDYRPHLA